MRFETWATDDPAYRLIGARDEDFIRENAIDRFDLAVAIMRVGNPKPGEQILVYVERLMKDVQTRQTARKVAE